MLQELDAGRICLHPHVTGELALWGVTFDSVAGKSLLKLKMLLPAKDDEVLVLLRTHKLAGTGIGYVDTHLLAATLITPDMTLLTLDRNLRKVAESLGVAA